MNGDQQNRISFVLFVLLMAGLILPSVQQFTKIVEVGPLYGAIEKVDKPYLSLTTWTDESFQSSTEKYLNQEFGFRNWLVRLHNQIAYSLFRETNAHSVVIGKKSYLYEENYIKTYYGRDYIGDSLMAARVSRLKFLQDTLASLGKELVMVMAPGKADFYPEYIPDHLKGKKSTTNYNAFIDAAAGLQLNVIDFNKWFTDQKEKSPYPLYPKTGIHWSRYAMNLVIDSLIRYIEAKRGIDMPDAEIGPVRLSQQLIPPDRDIEEGMNLIFNIPNFPMAYADITYNENGKRKPSVMVISDSFFWGLYNKGFIDYAFNNGEFWFYNREIFSPLITGSQMVTQVNLFEKLMEKDIVMLITTDANLVKFPWGFDESALFALKNLKEYNVKLLQRREKINDYIKAIKASPEWFEKVKAKAAKRNIPVDSMLRLDAAYMVDNEGK